MKVDIICDSRPYWDLVIKFLRTLDEYVAKVTTENEKYAYFGLINFTLKVSKK